MTMKWQMYFSLYIEPYRPISNPKRWELRSGIDSLSTIVLSNEYIWFTIDHYGELGLLRLNIFASNKRQQGWMIVVSNSYSVNVGLAIEVATPPLYKAGAPLLIYD